MRCLRLRFALQETGHCLLPVKHQFRGGDQPVLKAVVGLTAVCFVVIQVVTEMLYRALDPRLA